MVQIGGLNKRIKKLEDTIQPTDKELKPDLSELTTEELKILMNAIDNGTYELPEIQEIFKKIKWVEVDK